MDYIKGFSQIEKYKRCKEQTSRIKIKILLSSTSKQMNHRLSLLKQCIKDQKHAKKECVKAVGGNLKYLLKIPEKIRLQMALMQAIESKKQASADLQLEIVKVYGKPEVK